MQRESRILVAGYGGMVGSALVRALRERGHERLLLVDRSEVNLIEQAAVRRYFDQERPEFVFLAAARVGGILANNTYRAEFIYQNIMIAANVIHAAHEFGAKKLLNLGSSCIYPKLAPQPLKEEYLLTGELEPTNEPYAVAKIAALKLCESYRRQYGSNFVSVMPTNLYGVGDNFDPETSHVVPALIRKFHDAKVGNQPQVTLWGTGTPRREFLYVDDLADACCFLMGQYDDEPFLNVGWGEDLEIRELAAIIGDVVGFHGTLTYDASKPDGTPRKLLDASRLRTLGWRPRITLRDGIARTYEWFLEHVAPRVDAQAH
jgi:GDP-L-fucose synthase